MVGAEHGHRKQRGVGRPGGADGKGGYRNALGHLDDAVQRIHARQRLGLHRHTQHRHQGFGRQHAGQVRCAPGSGNDGAQAPPCGGFSVSEHIVGHAVRRDHAGFVRDAKLLENLGCMLHGVPVRAGAHDNTDLDGGGHPPILLFYP